MRRGLSDLTLAVLQPGYLPWLGFFDQLNRSDVFVIYDDVQFDKHGWRNRNRVKGHDGPVWLTVPVLHKGLHQPKIQDVTIDNRRPWARKHIDTIRQLYAASPYLDDYLGPLQELLRKPWELLVELDVAVITLMSRWLSVEARVVRSSQTAIQGDRSGRLLAFCEYFGASRYLSGSAAKEYLDVELFNKHKVEVIWQDFQHPVYPQMHGEFVPYLSALDLLLNCGPDAAGILAAAGMDRP